MFVPTRRTSSLGKLTHSQCLSICTRSTHKDECCDYMCGSRYNKAVLTPNATEFAALCAGSQVPDASDLQARAIWCSLQGCSGEDEHNRACIFQNMGATMGVLKITTNRMSYAILSCCKMGVLSRYPQMSHVILSGPLLEPQQCHCHAKGKGPSIP